MPDELLILCVDGSLTTAVKLAATSKVIKVKLQGSEVPLRVLARSIQNINQARQHGFRIGEVVWRDRLRTDQLRYMVTHLTHVHTIWVCPAPVRVFHIDQVVGHLITAEEYVRMLVRQYGVRYGIFEAFAIFARGIKVKPRARVAV